MNHSSGWIILLCIGVFALGIPVQILEYPGSRALTFYWKGFARGMPSWVAPCAVLLWLIAIAHFAWFALHSGWGVPAILDGQYVIDARGHILKGAYAGGVPHTSGSMAERGRFHHGRLLLYASDVLVVSKKRSASRLN